MVAAVTEAISGQITRAIASAAPVALVPALRSIVIQAAGHWAGSVERLGGGETPARRAVVVAAIAEAIPGQVARAIASVGPAVRRGG